jgi:Fur family ferric uptake transcriptional regulator
MENLHEREREQFLTICREHGLEETDKRLLVVEAFLATPDHVGVGALQRRLQEGGHHLDIPFIAETLDLLCRYGLAEQTNFEGQEIQYEHRHLGWHHDHFICAKCGKITEFHDPEMEALQRQLALLHSFTLLRHKMELYGICGECRVERQPVMPLAFVLSGERVVIDRLLGGREVQHRLAEMGLTPGTEIEVVKAGGPGPNIVACRGSRLALGHGLSLKVLVSARGRSAGNDE